MARTVRTSAKNGGAKRKPPDTIEQARRDRNLVAKSNIVEARAALNMISELVEMHAPAGTMPNMEYELPDIAIEAEIIVKGILAMVGKPEAPDPAEIIKRLRDSEINGALSWFYDGAWHWQNR